MRYLKNILDFYIRSSMHVALALVSLAYVINHSILYLMNPLKITLLFLTAVVGYNLTKYFHNWIHGMRFSYYVPITTLTITAAIGMGALLITYSSIEIIITYLLIGLIGLGYTIPVIRGRSLRYFPVVKLVSVSLVWVLMILPIWQSLNYIHHDFIRDDWFLTPWRSEGSSYFLRAIQVFIYIFALCLPFEIRDLKYDEEDLHTLPQMIGVPASRWLGFILCLLAAGIELLLYQNDFEMTSLNILFIILTAIMIAASHPKRSDYYASFWVEGIPILWLITMLLFA